MSPKNKAKPYVRQRYSDLGANLHEADDLNLHCSNDFNY